MAMKYSHLNIFFRRHFRLAVSELVCRIQLQQNSSDSVFVADCYSE